MQLVLQLLLLFRAVAVLLLDVGRRGWGWGRRWVRQAWGELGWRVVGGVGKARGEAEGEFERVKVDERGDERASYVVGDAEEEGGRLDRVRFPSEMEALDVLH